ncbi:hypothetical protein GCM10010405_25320 [Streptomyces macrosporus]|uniref:Uncharacterized protein n=1 Tax=Streptomyces macrosporus TaxID=44032 RepID=A0ABP5X374_9ACTN
MDLPALGRPTKQAKPARCGAESVRVVGREEGERSLMGAILPDLRGVADQGTECLRPGTRPSPAEPATAGSAGAFTPEPG